MWSIRDRSASALFLKALEECKSGKLVSPRGKTTLEIPSPVCLELYDIEDNLVNNPYRKLNYAFAIAELLSIIRGENKVEPLAYYNKHIAQFSDNGVTFAGAYGPPFMNQLGYILHALTKDQNTRQAVMTIWCPNPSPSKDIPCTVMLHFMIRDFKLDLTVYMRSNDVWLGLPYDIFNFTTIQQFVVAELKSRKIGIERGVYRHIVGSLHMYAGDVYRAEWAMRYNKTFEGLMPPVENANDLFELSAIEFLMRCKMYNWEELLPDLKTPFVKTWARVIYAYINKKEGQPYIFPEPVSRWREESARVHAAIAGSSNS